MINSYVKRTVAFGFRSEKIIIFLLGLYINTIMITANISFLGLKRKENAVLTMLEEDWPWPIFQVIQASNSTISTNKPSKAVGTHAPNG